MVSFRFTDLQLIIGIWGLGREWLPSSLQVSC